MSSKRKRAEEPLLSALAAGSPVEEAAKAAGLSPRTVYRRLAEPGFRGRLANARDELASEALSELAGCASEAVTTLRQLLRANNEHVQLGAARTLLDQLLRLREALALAERVAALERRLEHQQRRR
jgi:hypothetical protein